MILLKVGDVVRVIGHQLEGERTIVEVLNQERYDGGVRIDKPVDGIFIHWNEDSLIKVIK